MNSDRSRNFLSGAPVVVNFQSSGIKPKFDKEAAVNVIRVSPFDDRACQHLQFAIDLLDQQAKEIARLTQRAEAAETKLAELNKTPEIIAYCHKCKGAIRERDAMFRDGDRCWHAICHVTERAEKAENDLAEMNQYVDRVVLTRIGTERNRFWKRARDQHRELERKRDAAVGEAERLRGEIRRLRSEVRTVQTQDRAHELTQQLRAEYRDPSYELTVLRAEEEYDAATDALCRPPQPAPASPSTGESPS